MNIVVANKLSEHERADREYTQQMIIDLEKLDMQVSRIGRGR